MGVFSKTNYGRRITILGVGERERYLIAYVP